MKSEKAITISPTELDRYQDYGIFLGCLKKHGLEDWEEYSKALDEYYAFFKGNGPEYCPQYPPGHGEEV